MVPPPHQEWYKIDGFHQFHLAQMHEDGFYNVNVHNLLNLKYLWKGHLILILYMLHIPDTELQAHTLINTTLDGLVAIRSHGSMDTVGDP